MIIFPDFSRQLPNSGLYFLTAKENLGFNLRTHGYPEIIAFKLSTVQQAIEWVLIVQS
jgi:hypothetical protein